MAVFGARLDDLSHQARRVLRLTGPDTLRFLQGTVSANLHGQPQRTAIAATLLTVKAKIVSELIVLVQSEDTVDVVVPADTFDEVAGHLDRHIIMDDVEVIARDDRVAVVWGEDGSEAKASGWACAHPVAGVLVVGTNELVEAALASVQPADEEAFARHRVELGLPAWGYEVRAGFFPPEVGFVQAVSYDKGCYLGQEPLARIHARGQVNRVMVQVSLEGGLAAPAALSHPDRAEAGTLTTAVGDRGLAIVRRTFATPNTTLETGGTRVQVMSAPLGDDPGVGGRQG